MKRVVAGVFGLAAILFLFFLFQSKSKNPSQGVLKAPISNSGFRTVPSAEPSSLPRFSASISDHDRGLLRTLDQIFARRNDNDPRLDTEFRHLSPVTKDLLIQKYQSLPMEARNERGTIVFLIGREINRPEDCRFLAQVTAEPQCLNLSDCKKAPSHTDEDVHEESAISVTLAYPQHVAVKSMEKFFETGNPVSSLQQACLGSLNQMTESPVSPIAREASLLQDKVSEHGN